MSKRIKEMEERELARAGSVQGRLRATARKAMGR
jgi:hypothetical protein